MPPSGVGELRDLLGTPAVQEFAALESRVAELEELFERHTTDPEVGAAFVSRSLPASITHSAAAGPELNRSLQPEIVTALSVSSRSDPEEVAEALFPVLGRAVRMIVASMFTSDDRPGSFAIDEVFLIERASGLPLAHIQRDKSKPSNSDVVSGMLEAIRSFVQDSFNAADHDGMRELSVGDVTLLVEWGPQALLAVVVHGFPPGELREKMQIVLEQVHIEHHVTLEAFGGDPQELASVEPTLHGLIETKSSVSKTLMPFGFALAAVIVFGLPILALVVALTR